MAPRRAERKLDSKKLSALERLKKIRAGEKVSDEEEVEEDDYEYIEEEDSEEEEFVSKKNPLKVSKNKKENSYEAEKQQQLQSKKHKGKLTRDKVSHAEEETEATQNKSLDIRNAFFKAAQKPKSDKFKADSQKEADNDDDDLAMEIMKELNQVKWGLLYYIEIYF